MKKQTGIQIDKSKALLIQFEDGEKSIREIESHIDNPSHHETEGDPGSFMGGNHITLERKFEKRANHQIDNFLKSVINEVKDSDELYIFGPAELKLKLRDRIEHDRNLSSKLRGVDTTDSMTLNQSVAKVRDFFAQK